MALFILDFDNTITSENTHNAVSNISNGGLEAIWDIVGKIPPLGSANSWKNAINSIFEHEHLLAIASFNAYGTFIIPRYLEEVIGLDITQIENIHIESWLPANPTNANKNEHIELSIKDLKYTGPSHTVVLIDDDLKNIQAAKEKGYKTIHAVGDYINELENVSKNGFQFVPKNSFFKKQPNEKGDGQTEPMHRCTIL